MHDEVTTEKFRRDHDIPNDVLIKRSGPKEESNTVEGNRNRIPVRTWLIHQAGLRFPIRLFADSPLCNYLSTPSELCS